MKSRIDVRGAPGGRVELISDSGGVLQDVFADGRRGADAGTIYIGEENDPPSGVGGFGVRGKISARSRDGQGGRVTMRGCRIVRNVQEPASIEVSGTGAQILFQGRVGVWLPLTLIAEGPGASIRVEYASELRRPDVAIPEPEFVQYPNPTCDCAMTLAECMTAP